MKSYKILFFILLAGCSSDPKKSEPSWAQNPTRTIDNGYIVYVGTGLAMSTERAHFIAEGQALEDLANECSMIPKGTRLEDRFTEEKDRKYTAFVKVGLEFKDCEMAKKLTDPSEIKKIANVPFTEQLKRYQDFVETGEVASQTGVVDVPSEMLEAPVRSGGTSESTHFYLTRQYVAYQKEIVILSPPSAYAPQSPEAQKFASVVAPTTEQLQNLETKNPQFRNHPEAWSHLPDRPRMARPPSLSSSVPRSPRLPPAITHAQPMRHAYSRGAPGPKGSRRGKKKKTVEEPAK